MALSIDPCHDVEKFQESVIAGLNAKKTIYLVIALLCGGTIALVFMLLVNMHPLISVYAAAPASFFVLAMGLYEKDGMNMFQLIKKGRSKNQNKPIGYVSTETKTEYEKHGKVVAVQDKETADAEFERLKKMMIYGGVGAVLVIVIVIVLLVVLL